MNLNNTPLYFKPYMWKKDYYTVKEFCTLLGSNHSLFLKKFYDAVFSDFHKATFTGFEDVYHFERLREGANANGFLTPNVLTPKARFCFLPFYSNGDIDFLVSKEGALAFIDSHQQQLVDLGVSKTHIKAILNNIPFQKEEPQNVWCLWDFTKKFTKNSKNVLKLSEYISDNLFDARYPKQMPDGSIQEEPMFLYWRGKRRSTNFFFKAEAFDYFKKEYAPLLAQKEAEIEAQNEFISIRHFLLKVSGKHISDKMLSDFIKQKAIDDVYEETDATGNSTVKKMFEVDHGIISMRKNAIYPFTLRYQNELKSFGLLNMNHILNQSIRLSDLPAGAISLSKLFKKHQLQKVWPQMLLVVEKAYNKQKSARGKSASNPLLKSYYHRNQEEYYIDEKDATAFFSRFYKKLKSLGANQDRLDHLVGKRSLVKRTPSMVQFREMFYALGIHPCHFKRLRDEIETKFINDTYEHQDETGAKSLQPVFIKATTQHSISYLFKNKQAMQSFLRAHADFFLENKVNPLRLNDASGIKPILPISNEQLTIEALAQLLSLSSRFKDYVHKNLIDATYQSAQEEALVEKKMFTHVRSSTGHIVYAIDKQAIPALQEKIKQYRINSDRQRKR